jgi:hypothetical protein
MIIYTGQKSRHEILTKPRFDLNKLGQNEAIDQEGPGFYFTTNKDEAKGYAFPNGIIVTAEYDKNNLLSVDSKPNKNHINKMIQMAPDLDDTLANWGYDPGYTSKLTALNDLKDAIYSDDNAKDIFLTIWYELYRYNPKQYIENSIKLGYDGLLIKKDYGQHVVLYNVNSINITDVEKYKSEEEVKKESIKFFDHYFKESNENNFIGICNNIRCDGNGETWWKNVMKNKIEITQDEFLKHVNPSNILDDDESWEDYYLNMVQSDSSTKFYKTNNVYFFQYAGFEYFWEDKNDQF